MKTFCQILKTIGLTGLVMAIGTRFALAQETQDPTSLVQEFSIRLDKLGDAQLELSQKMDAQQWESFKSGPLVNDPAISKRDLERAMSTYVLEGFKRDIDEMNRSVKLSVKIMAMAQYKGGGRWELKLDSKNPQVTKLADNAYMTNTNTLIGGQLIQQTYQIYFPAAAGDIQQTTDSFGKAIFTYQLGGGIGSLLSWNNILGILLILLAVGLFVKRSN
jgi:hypothetical protein